MEFVWLAHSEARNSHQEDSRIRIRHESSTDMLPRVFSEANRNIAVLILEISQETDRASAFIAVERWRDHVPVWILDPGATVALSVRWIKAGASHVATRVEEITEQMRIYPEAHAPREKQLGLIGDSPSMRSLESRIQLVAERR